MTKADPHKISYLTLSSDAQIVILREQLAMREQEHFRLYAAFGGADNTVPDHRLGQITAEVQRLQDEIKALEA